MMPLRASSRGARIQPPPLARRWRADYGGQGIQPPSPKGYGGPGNPEVRIKTFHLLTPFIFYYGGCDSIKKSTMTTSQFGIDLTSNSLYY